MIIAKTIAQARSFLTPHRRAGRRIGFVPTMGALHEGHVSLIRRCKEECDVTVVSIFVNPTQFGPNEDLSKYPRPFEKDSWACQQAGTELIFAPEPAEMYQPQTLTWVTVDKLTEHLCGASRPGHFRGVCTVVNKLFNIVQPDVAYFGQKDAQQLAILRRMTEELYLPVEIRPCPTVREADGLAMSSRNQYLNPQERLQALCLWKSLQKARELFENGQKNSKMIVSAMRQIIGEVPAAKIDYISIVDNELLQTIDTIDRAALIALAVFVGSTRLIDNIVVDPASKTP